MELCTLEKVFDRVRGLPFMSHSQAERMTQLILENRFQNVLELGFFHGVSTCYIASALSQLGTGHVTTIDLLSAQKRKPNIETLVADLNLKSFVSYFYEPTSYLWRLMKFLEESPQRQFDLCYIDGGHDWYNSGFAFFLVDKLLRPGGMIVFDDVGWTHESSPALKRKWSVLRMPKEEKSTAQIQKVFDLLVRTHPNYCDFKVENGWASTRKKL